MHRYAYALVEEYANETDRLLEIGFGEGYGSEIVREWVDEYVGVEVDDEAVRHANDRYSHSKSTFLSYDGATLPFADSAFDIAISFQVLEHVPDPARFVREARRVVRQGGVVLVVTPNRNHRLADGERPWNRYHVREFNADELAALMRGAFDRVEVYGIHGSEEMNAIERSRVARARKLARRDPLGLRYRLPESLDTRLRVALRRRSRDDSKTPVDIGVEHMRHARDDISSSLDLLAVGRT